MVMNILLNFKWCLLVITFILAITGCTHRKAEDPFVLAMKKLDYLNHCQDASIDDCNLQVVMEGIRFFQDLTGIYSDSELTVIGPMKASDQDIYLWKEWLENNKDGLLLVDNEIVFRAVD